MVIWLYQQKTTEKEKQMTNGEKIKEIFPTFEFIEETEKYRTPQHQFLKVHGVNKMPYMEFDLGWWNAEYKESTTKNCESCGYNGLHREVCNYCYKCSLWTEQEPTTKNDLGVDCIKKSDAINIIQDMHGLARADVISDAVNKIIELPSVTPQEPRKGHWILTDVEGNRIWHCNCSECGKDPLNYIGGSENWWLIKSKLPKFCPNCGSDNREVEE